MPAISPQTAKGGARQISASSVGWVEMHLGTTVQIVAYDASEAVARRAITAAFAEIARIHRLMSFHSTQSDVSRLNRMASRSPVTVDPCTTAVLKYAQALAETSAGVFDVTVAPAVVEQGGLPLPEDAPAPATEANWQDLVLLPGNRVAFRKPLWIDLGGIAKGYAVDRAFHVCQHACPGAQILVNAGGDLRIGKGSERVIDLQVPGHRADQTPRIELADGSMASSYAPGRDGSQGLCDARHIHGHSRSLLSSTRFVTVLARDCVTADALTKVVLAQPATSDPVLAPYEATAMVHEADEGWRQIPG